MATATTFNEQQFEKRLLTLKDTQESISSLSSWCLQQHQHHKKIVSLWLQVLKKVKIEQRLTLFYLANDVIQYSKRKGYDFVESWGTALQRATTMVRDDKVKNKILRLFKIWDERSIYDEAFLVDLSGLLTSRGPARSNSQEAQDFQPPVLIAKIRSCKELEDDTDYKLKVVNESHLSLSDAEAMRSSLKDRKHGADIEAEVDDGIGKMNAYIEALKAEIKERASVIELLDHAEAFYENQRGEAKIVCNAYRNFGTRVKALKRKLDELITTLPSPIPSPDVNAPSPSPESDIELPEDNPGKGYTTTGSFIGTLVMPDKVKLSESTPEKVAATSSSSSMDYDSPKHSYRPPTPPNRKYSQPPPPKPAKSPPPKYQTPTKQVTPEPYRPVTTTAAPPIPYGVKPDSKTTSYVGTNKSYEPVLSSPYQTTKTTGQSYTAPVTTSPAVTSYVTNNNSSPVYGTTYPSTTYSSNTAPIYTSNNSHPYPPVTPPSYTSSYQSTTTTTQSYLPNNIPAYPASSDPLVNTNYNSTPPFPPPDYSLPPPTVHNQHTTHTPDYSVPPPNPFYQSSNTTMPPLLGEDFPVNGTDSFLQQQPPLSQSNSKRENSGGNLPGLGSGFSTFMGSSNLPFDIQKGGIFSDTSCDTPASPIPEHSIDDNSQNYLSDSNTTTQISSQGKPIEVISMSTPTDISEILKALGMPTGGRGTSTTNSTVSPTSSVGPRPVTSNILDDVYQEEELEKHWNQPPLLPSKFPTWGQPDWVDTPASPPLYEKSGYVDPVEYDESDSLILAEQDTDLRSLTIDRVPHGDIDHRNLISLTSSPRDETCWSSTKDTDYRRIALVSKAGAQDNVESVDMEMSSEEEMDSITTTAVAATTTGLVEVIKAASASTSTTTVSFSLNTNTKVLPESPLIEKEDVKPKKPPPKLDILTPPHDLLSEPPSVPDVAEIFPDLLDSNDSGVADEPESSTVHLLPPPPAPPALPISKVEDIKKNKVVEEFHSPAPPPLPVGPPPFMHPQHRMKVNFMNTRPPPPPPPPPLPRGFFPRRGNLRHCGPRFRLPPPSMPPQQPPPVQMDMSFRGRPPFRAAWRPRFPT